MLGSGNAEGLACLPDGAEFAPMRLDELAPHAWPWLKKARKFYGGSFSRPSPSASFLGLTVS